MWEQAHKNRGTDVKNKLLGKGNNPIKITREEVKNLKEKDVILIKILKWYEKTFNKRLNWLAPNRASKIDNLIKDYLTSITSIRMGLLQSST